MVEYEDRTGRIPTLSIEERDRRWATIREHMYQQDIDCLLVWGLNKAEGIGKANIRYLTQVPGQSIQVSAVAVFPYTGAPVVFNDIPHLHKPYNVYKSYQDWVEDTRLLDFGEVIAEIRARGLTDGRIGIVGQGGRHSVPHRFYEQLAEELPDVEFVEATHLIENARIVKSEGELDMLRRAGEIGHEMAEEFMRAEPGQREHDLYAGMVSTQIRAGGEASTFILMDSGSPVGGQRKHLMHGKGKPLSPSRYQLSEGDLVICEYHANYGGYLVAAEKSIVLGSAPEELEAVHQVCLDCFDSGLEFFTPGTRLVDLWEAIRAPALEADMDFIELGFHGHGLGSPEFPAVVYSQEPTRTYPEGMKDHFLSGEGLEEVRLREGMVLGVNIDVHDPEWRDDVGLMFGDTVHVSAAGPEKLVDTPIELMV